MDGFFKRRGDGSEIETLRILHLPKPGMYERGGEQCRRMLLVIQGSKHRVDAMRSDAGHPHRQSRSNIHHIRQGYRETTFAGRGVN